MERTGRDLTPVISPDEQRPPQSREQSFEPSILNQPTSRDGHPTRDGIPTSREGLHSVDSSTSAPNDARGDSTLGSKDKQANFDDESKRINGGTVGDDKYIQRAPGLPSPPPPNTRELEAFSLPHAQQNRPAAPDLASPSSIYSSTPSQLDSAFPSTQETSEESAARNLLIRDQPIPEDETEAQKALSSTANQLRMQAPMARVQGSTRGRRDVRNTIFVANTPETSNGLGGISNTAVTGTGAAGMAAGAAASVGAMDLASPIRQPSTPGLIPEDRTNSDTASLHSSHSLANVAQHPTMEAPGLNASIIETVSTWFTEGSINKSFVVGEVALAMNGLPEDNTETIRLSNFQILEKVAANPTFVHTAVSDKGKEKDTEPGEYTVDVNAIRKSTPTVALKYQIHLEAEIVAAYSPVIVTPAWQCHQGQVSVIVLYALNRGFVGATSGEVVLKNVVITVSLDTSDGTKATGAMMSPQQGASFKRKAGAVVWRMNELRIGGTAEEKLLVRFMTNTPADAVPKKGTVEAKWEYDQVGASTGQQLGVTRLAEGEAGEQADPFADEGEAKSGRNWVDVNTRRKLMSGRYSAL